MGDDFIAFPECKGLWPVHELFANLLLQRLYIHFTLLFACFGLLVLLEDYTRFNYTFAPKWS